MADAQQGGQAKVDALLALAQRTVFVVPWPRAEDGLRTLVSSSGESALPIFSDAGELTHAVDRFGWRGPDGGIPSREVGSREALRYARERNLAYVVVDIAADHSMEISREEIEPLLTPAARRDSTGPFSGAGRVSSTLMRAVKPTPHNIPAASPIDAPRTSIPHSIHAPPPGQPASSPGTVPSVHTAATAPGTIAAEPAGPPVALQPSTRMGAPMGTIEDSLLDRLDHALRDFPEVEFACVGSVSGHNAFGLRVDARMRKRLEQLGAALGKVAPPGAAFHLLDDPEHFRAARAEALVFFPWRRR